jgi:hypothetical protein
MRAVLEEERVTTKARFAGSRSYVRTYCVPTLPFMLRVCRSDCARLFTTKLLVQCELGPSDNEDGPV